MSASSFSRSLPMGVRKRTETPVLSVIARLTLFVPHGAAYHEKLTYQSRLTGPADAAAVFAGAAQPDSKTSASSSQRARFMASSPILPENACKGRPVSRSVPAVFAARDAGAEGSALDAARERSVDDVLL